MALPNIADWVAETTNTIGTGDIQLTGQITGFSPFSVMGDGKVYYTVQEGFDKEIGIGTLDASSNVLKRTQIIATIINNKYSTNGSPMNLKGYGEVFCTISTDLIKKIYDAIDDSSNSLGELRKVVDSNSKSIADNSKAISESKRLIDENKKKLDTIEENAKDDQDASEVPYTPADKSVNKDNVAAMLDYLYLNLGISDAPKDGNPYVRKNASWQKMTIPKIPVINVVTAMPDAPVDDEFYFVVQAPEG